MLLGSTIVSFTAGGSLHETITALARYTPVLSRSAVHSTPLQASAIEHSNSSLPEFAARSSRTSQVEVDGTVGELDVVVVVDVCVAVLGVVDAAVLGVVDAAVLGVVDAAVLGVVDAAVLGVVDAAVLGVVDAAVLGTGAIYMHKKKSC